MTSQIINMVDRMKSSEDRALETLFRSEPLPDGGFSARVAGRIRRRLWLRRLLVPAAVLAGGLVAVKPASAVLGMALGTVFRFEATLPPASVPMPGVVSALLPGVLLLVGLMATLRLLED